MGNRTIIHLFCVCICMFAHLFVESYTATATLKNSENSPQNSGDVIMREDAEEVFYNIDLEKYNDLGVKCPDPEPPENGFIVGEGNSVGSVVYVQCHEGYKLDGRPVMACMPLNGKAQWDPPLSEQRKCYEDPENPRNNWSGNIETQHKGNSQGIQQKKSSSSTNNISDPPSINPRIHLSWAQQKKHKDIEIPGEEPVEHEITIQLPPFCLQKQEKGPCRATIKRYYFSKATMECHPFIFGGCQGNENNFESVRDCNLACLGQA